MTNSVIVADILSEPVNQDSNSDDKTGIQLLVTHAEACMAFETGLKWLEAEELKVQVHFIFYSSTGGETPLLLRKATETETN